MKLSDPIYVELSGSDVVDLSGSDIIGLSASDIVELSASDILKLSASDILKLSDPLHVELSGSDVVDLSGSDIIELSASDIVGLSASDILRLSGFAYRVSCPVFVVYSVGFELGLLSLTSCEVLHSFLNIADKELDVILYLISVLHLLIEMVRYNLFNFTCLKSNLLAHMFILLYITNFTKNGL